MNLSTIQNTFVKIRSNRLFEGFVIAVIIFSALVIGAKTYNIPQEVLRIIEYLDVFITVVFLTEIIIRFVAEEKKADFFKQGWNVFDTIIVALSLIPVSNGDMALVGRLLRIFRVLRMVSIIPELRILLNSLIKALPQLGYVALLLFIIFYIFAAMGTILFAEINPYLWGDITEALITLFRVMTFEDWTDVMYETREQYPFSPLYFISFIFLSAFAFLNMVIGIIVQVLEKEGSLEQKNDLSRSLEPTLDDLSKQIEELKSLVLAQQLANKK